MPEDINRIIQAALLPSRLSQESLENGLAALDRLMAAREAGSAGFLADAFLEFLHF